MTEQVMDPYAAAMAAKERPPVFWGSLMTDAQFVVLEKGIGRIPFDPNQHPQNRRVTGIDLSLLPIAEMNLQNPIERNAIAEFGEWLKIILPSLKALGVELRDLQEKFVKIQLVPTGRKYKVEKEDGTTEERDATTMKFLAVFENENACLADYLSGNEVEPEPSLADAVMPATQPAPAAQPANDPEKETARKFLDVLLDNAVNGQTDPQVVKDTLAVSFQATPFVAKHFDIESQEVLDLINQKIGG